MADEPLTPVWPRAGADLLIETSAADLCSIAPVRHAAIRHLDGYGCSNVDDAVLVLSELVTNAVIHGGGANSILVACDDDWIGVSVRDNEPAPARIRNDRPRVGGRGLRIVERLAEQWGSRPLETGKSVWAVLPAAATSS